MVRPRRKLRECLEYYLTLAHVQCPDSGCALPALGAEIARSDAAVREDAEHWMSQLQQGWARILGDEALAWAYLAQCVGALVVARMLVSADTQQQVLAGSKALLFSQLKD
jgi:TetR/AcrR family transcriptional repressor of nem operon